MLCASGESKRGVCDSHVRVFPSPNRPLRFLGSSPQRLGFSGNLALPITLKMLGLPNLGTWNDFWYMIPVLRFGRRDK
jgi:hypothetical protein